MFDVVMLVGWGGTAAVAAVEWVRRRPRGSWVVGVLLGLLFGILWPVTAWIVGGMWWLRRSAVPTVDHAAVIREAEAHVHQARVEHMPSSAAYWTDEVERRRVAARTAEPVRPRPRAAVAGLCTVGSLLTLVLFGQIAPPPQPVPAAQSAEAAAVPRPAAPRPVEPPRPDRVTSVIDGDTVVVSRDGAPVTVRLLGIDAPEVGPSPDCWATESTDFARRMLLGREVDLVEDPTQAATDAYGRTLAYVETADGTDFSTAAARAGAARTAVYAGPVARHTGIADAEALARATGAGMWTTCAAPPVAPPSPAAQAVPPPAPELEPRPAQIEEAPAVEAAAAPSESAPSDCDPNYSGACVPMASDVDCEGGSGNGPEYVRGPVQVVGEDVYDLDRDGNGEGCE